MEGCFDFGRLRGLDLANLFLFSYCALLRLCTDFRSRTGEVLSKSSITQCLSLFPRTRVMENAGPLSLLVTKVNASPVSQARPVRPMRCVYASADSGMS